MTIHQEINNIISQINQDVTISEIYLFGSHAYGTPNKSSDIDLCIITDDYESRKRDLIVKIRRSISNTTNISVDILLYRSSEFYNRANLPFTMEFKIKKEGIILYNKNAAFNWFNSLI